MALILMRSLAITTWNALQAWLMVTRLPWYFYFLVVLLGLLLVDLFTVRVASNFSARTGARHTVLLTWVYLPCFGLWLFLSSPLPAPNCPATCCLNASGGYPNGAVI